MQYLINYEYYYKDISKENNKTSLLLFFGFIEYSQNYMVRANHIILKIVCYLKENTSQKY